MLRWSDTRQSWDDARAEQFEAQYFRQLESDLKAAGSAMDQVGTLLNEVRRDCE